MKNYNKYLGRAIVNLSKTLNDTFPDLPPKEFKEKLNSLIDTFYSFDMESSKSEN